MEPDVRSNKESKAAGGVPAIVAAVKSISDEMGLVRGVRTLLQVNQRAESIVPVAPGRSRIANVRILSFVKTARSTLPTKRPPNASRRSSFKSGALPNSREQSDQWLNAQGRLTHPMLLRRGATHYEPVSWDDAFELIAG